MRPLVLVVALLGAGCVTAATTAYKSATDERPVSTQADDAAIATKIRKGLLDTGVKNLTALDVFCHQAVVVLVGVVEPGSRLGEQGVAIARGVEGVTAVKSFIQLKSP